MAGTRFLCCTDGRRAALQARPALNGIDYLEVADLAPGDLDPAEAAQYASLPAAKRAAMLWQRKLTAYFVNPLRPGHVAALTPDALRLDGGDRPDSRNLQVAVLAIAPESIVLRANGRGDFSVYRLSIVRAADDRRPPETFDPLFAAVDFSFKVACPTEFDCAAEQSCAPAPRRRIDNQNHARD
jgi:hypothetical protein